MYLYNIQWAVQKDFYGIFIGQIEPDAEQMQIDCFQDYIMIPIQWNFLGSIGYLGYEERLKRMKMERFLIKSINPVNISSGAQV